MTIQFKNQKSISLVIITFALFCFISDFIYNKFNLSNAYIYSYTGIVFLSLISFFTANFTIKYPDFFFLLRFLEAHFIIMLALQPRSTISIIILIIILMRINLLLKGMKGLILSTEFFVINFILCSTFLILYQHENIKFAPFYIIDILSIIFAAIFLYFVTKDYDKTFLELEQAHAETTMNNQLLSNTIGELSTLQEISKFANSILNIKELINIINDAIIGVIGVNYSSIFLINDSSDNFYLESTNIKDKNIVNSLRVMLSTKYLSQFKGRGLSMIEGRTCDTESLYPHAADRDIKTFLIAALQSHRNFLGLIVVESCFEGAFEEKKKKMLATICNQVSMAIENAVIYEKMEKLATIDGLTQVHNRRYFNERCLEEFSVLTPTSLLSVAMLDIDNFKKINDTYGHMLGDSVLKKVASVISSTTCSDNSEDFLVARYGGEEFVVLMRNTDLSTSYNIMEVVRKNIESCSVYDDEGKKIKFTISVGVAEYPSTSQNAKEILRDADTALYNAKETGKNKVVAVDDIK